MMQHLLTWLHLHPADERELAEQAHSQAELTRRHAERAKVESEELEGRMRRLRLLRPGPLEDAVFPPEGR